MNELGGLPNASRGYKQASRGRSLRLAVSHLTTEVAGYLRAVGIWGGGLGLLIAVRILIHDGTWAGRQDIAMMGTIAGCIFICMRKEAKREDEFLAVRFFADGAVLGLVFALWVSDRSLGGFVLCALLFGIATLVA